MFKEIIFQIYKKMKTNIPTRKMFIILLILLFPILLLGFLNYFFSYSSYKTIIDYDENNYINIFPDNVINITGYEYENNKFFTSYHDPQILISPPDQIITSTIIKFKEPIGNNRGIQVFYAENQNDFYEENSEKKIIIKGSYECIINLPSAHYSSLRYDIDIFNEVFYIEGIYISDLPFIYNRIWIGNFDGLLMTLIICLIIIILWYFSIFTDYYKEIVNSFFLFLKRVKNIKKLIKYFFISVLIFLLSILIDYILSKFSLNNDFIYLRRVLLFFISGISIFIIKNFYCKPEKLFLFLSLPIGLLYILSFPSWYGFDEQIHFALSVEESFARTVSINHSLYKTTNTIGHRANINEDSHLSNSTFRSFKKGTDTLSPYPINRSSFYTRVGYLPASIMIFIGRSIALPTYFIIILGLIGNHIAYTIIIYFAIKRLNSGKYILSIIAMFPTSFVQSTTYSIDFWVISLLMLGFAYLFYELQNPENVIKLKSILIILFSFFLGLGPKAIYFPLMFFIFFLNKRKFNTNKGHLIFIVSTSIIILFIICSFMLPYIASIFGGEVGDTRSPSTNVNATEQTLFILKNPLTYAKTLFIFLLKYLNIFTTQNFVTFYAHLGSSSFFHLVWTLLFFTVITDRNTNDIFTSNLIKKCIISLITLTSIILVSTVFYIIFSTVGGNSIRGVQGRYILPLLFPFLYIVGSLNIINNINKTVYTISIFSIMSFVLLYGAWQMFLN